MTTSKVKLPYELLINKLIDSLKTPDLVQMRQLPVPKTTPVLSDKKPNINDPILTDSNVYSNITAKLINDLKKMVEQEARAPKSMQMMVAFPLSSNLSLQDQMTSKLQSQQQPMLMIPANLLNFQSVQIPFQGLNAVQMRNLQLS